MIRVLGHIKAHEPFPQIEGLRALCNDCGAVIVCDTVDERDALHVGDETCPHCKGCQVCSCTTCIASANGYRLSFTENDE